SRQWTASRVTRQPAVLATPNDEISRTDVDRTHQSGPGKQTATAGRELRQVRARRCHSDAVIRLYGPCVCPCLLDEEAHSNSLIAVDTAAESQIDLGATVTAYTSSQPAKYVDGHGTYQLVELEMGPDRGAGGD